MMEIGFSKILLIAALALIVLGPDKLPKVAAEIGRWVGRARAMSRQFREQLEEEAVREPTFHKSNVAPSAAPAANAAAAPPEPAPASPVSPTSPVSSAEPNNPAAPSDPSAVPRTEIIPDQAELFPHSPMEDPHATADAARDSDHAADSHLPRL